MKLIQIHPQSSFLTFQGMTINVAGYSILFGGLDNTTLHQFDCLNDFVAQEIYKFLVSCLVDAESFEADLPYRHAILADCWKIAPTLAPAMIALRDAAKGDKSFTELKPFKDDYLSLDPQRKYANSDGVASFYGKFVLQFAAIQEQSKP